MHLVMFDIDGTLTESMKVDEECFVRSFKEVFGFADISSNCWLPLQHSLHLHRLQGLTGCCPSSHGGARIAWRLLLEVGVIPPASRWPVPGCALTTIRRHQRMTRSTGSLL